jgi:hypothetical protein
MTTSGTARQAGNSDTLQHLARVGLIAYGIVHVLIAWLAVQLAWFGGSGESTDQSGALSTLAESPLGRPLLWVLAIGLIALAAWQAAEVFRWKSGWSASGKARSTAIKKSVKAVVKAIVYAALAVLALRFATGSGQSGGSGQQTTSGVFGWPGGQWLVGAAGLVVVAVGVYLIHKGLTRRFLEEIDLSECSPSARRAVTRLGQAGFPAKGVSLALVGGLLIWAAITFDASKAGGLDGALQTVLELPFGKILLTLVAVGIAAFGAFCFVRARYPERT